MREPVVFARFVVRASARAAIFKQVARGLSMDCALLLVKLLPQPKCLLWLGAFCLYVELRRRQRAAGSAHDALLRAAYSAQLPPCEGAPLGAAMAKRVWNNNKQLANKQAGRPLAAHGDHARTALAMAVSERERAGDGNAINQLVCAAELSCAHLLIFARSLVRALFAIGLDNSRVDVVVVVPASDATARRVLLLHNNQPQT